MHNTKWFSFKHNAWAIVTSDPKTKNGFYTVEFPSLGIFRRYNATRIRDEISNQANIDAQLDAQLVQTNIEAKIGRGRHTSPAYTSTPVSAPIANSSNAAVIPHATLLAKHWSAPRKPSKNSAKKEGKLIGLVFAWKD